MNTSSSSKSIDTHPARSIVVERLITQAPAKIWRALTTPQLIQRWLMENDFEPRAGHRFNFRAQPMPGWNGVTDCQVLAVEPDSRLVYTWNASGEQAATGLKSTVTWTLTPVEGGTLLRMEQSGFRPEDEDGYRAMSSGWQRIVAQLAAVSGSVPNGTH
jgi:uncharacterized protein YndB with AHSA1/START domain